MAQTLKEQLAAARAKQEIQQDTPPAESVVTNPATPPAALSSPVTGYMGRRDGTEPIPMNWPSDPAAFAKGNELAVVIDENEKGWLAVIRGDLPPLYLMGPLRSLNLPF